MGEGAFEGLGGCFVGGLGCLWGGVRVGPCKTVGDSKIQEQDCRRIWMVRVIVL